MSNKCTVCGKSVYPADPQVKMHGVVFHKGCFKCKVCQTPLSEKTAKTVGGKDLYCHKDMPEVKATAVADSMHTQSARTAPPKAYKPGGYNAAVKGAGGKHSSVIDKRMELAMNAPKKTAEGLATVQKGTGEAPTAGVDLSMERAMKAPKKNYGVTSHNDQTDNTEDAANKNYVAPVRQEAGGADDEPADEPAADEPAADEPAADEPAADEPADEPAAGGGEFIGTCKAEFAYDAEGEDELSFPEGATVNVVEFIDEGWWQGEYEGAYGMFPSTYVVLNQ